jgi:hypothetical protein
VLDLIPGDRLILRLYRGEPAPDRLVCETEVVVLSVPIHQTVGFPPARLACNGEPGSLVLTDENDGYVGQVEYPSLRCSSGDHIIIDLFLGRTT